MQAGSLHHKGFTLVEVLVVIAIVGVLISILLPALGKARLLGRQTRELATGQQLMLAFAVYADDSKGYILPGYPPRAMVNGPVSVVDHAGVRLFNEEAQRYPWRIAPYLSYDFRGMYENSKVLAELRSGESSYSGYGVSYAYIVSLFPSLGMNTAFVGGSDRHQEFDQSFRRVFGRVYVERLDEPRRPSVLMAFVSARTEPQSAVPFLGRPEGFFRVEPPRFAASQGRQWESSYDKVAAYPGLNSGFVSLRYGGKAVATHLDGHAAMLGWDELGDMQRWADQADGADWAFQPR